MHQRLLSFLGTCKHGAQLLESSTMWAAAGVALLTMLASGASLGQPGIPVTPLHNGYFSDPYPIHLALKKGTYLPPLVGTTTKILECTSLAPNCYDVATPIHKSAGSSITNQLNNANAQICSYENNNIYQMTDGTWHMAVTGKVRSSSAACDDDSQPRWDVVLHASVAPGSPVTQVNSVPTTWVVDKLLVGSFSDNVPGGYDGKYIEDKDGSLYLIYNKRLQSSPAVRLGIVAQAMNSPTQRSSSSPKTLLSPRGADGSDNTDGFTSELRNCLPPADYFKLIETGNITWIGNKYAMAYSVGAYNRHCYKSGVAWSDSLLGPYKRALMPNQGCNGLCWPKTQIADEVVYLLQSQISGWPNYENRYVHAPGVPSLVEYPVGVWHMFFAGYAPSEQMDSNGLYIASHRQPYYVPLTRLVPQDKTVAKTANTLLPNWLTLTQP